jgi:hypothetical protein
MMDTTSHDHLFKEVLGQFFSEFIDLFFPDIAAFLDRDSIQFEPLEVFPDLLKGKANTTDLIVKAKFLGTDTYFIIHLEHQAEFDAYFDRRMFQYFALLERDYDLPIYPIVIFSHRSPKQSGDRSYTINFPGWQVLQFNYRVIRLNHLPWKDFLNSPNPVASAFMSKMKIPRRDRPFAKLACLKMLAQLQLNPAQNMLLSGFIDTYLELDAPEETILQTELDRMGLSEKESVMQIVTSWMKQGLEQGHNREVAFALKIMRQQFGALSLKTEQTIAQLSPEQLDELGDRILEFTSEAELQQWVAGD